MHLKKGSSLVIDNTGTMLPIMIASMNESSFQVLETLLLKALDVLLHSAKAVLIDMQVG